MSLVDKIKELLATEQGTATSPDPAPPADPAPTDPPADQEPPAPETFTREEVQDMLANQQKETEAALKEIVKSFKGQGAPPVSDPAQPVETASDFSEWNKQIEAINENLKN